MNLTDRIITTLRDNLEKKMEIKPESRLAEDLMVDSFERLMIIAALEDEFNIGIEDKDFQGIITVQDIIARVEAMNLSAR